MTRVAYIKEKKMHVTHENKYVLKKHLCLIKTFEKTNITHLFSPLCLLQ